MKNVPLVLVILLVVAVGGYFLLKNSGGYPAENQGPVNGAANSSMPVTPQTGTSNPSAPTAEKAVVHTITYTDSGYSPSPLEIKKGEMVEFKNGSSKPMWPASAFHPTHKAYPGSDIEKCQTTERNTIFDACEGIQPGSSWSFTFNNIGSWKYHDHLNASKTGVINVK